MNIIMNLEKLKCIEDLKNFIESNEQVSLTVAAGKSEKYAWIRDVLIKFRYRQLSKKDKGIVIRYIIDVTNYSRQQITRLIAQYNATGKIIINRTNNHKFSKKYTKEDIFALLEIDRLHGTINGKTTKILCQRAFRKYSDQRYGRLRNISVSHLYNLRASYMYRSRVLKINKTKPCQSNIAERRKPCPNGSPGYLRIDTVHQGDLDGSKGVYHINAVDEVTQYQIIYTVERISEMFLIPALKYILDAFPFKILGFHSDNGSEYINYTVARLLNKLHIGFTKSRARKSNDNGLVESKNGSIIRKIYGHDHIPQKYAQRVNVVNLKYVNYYINYHRPCLFPTDIRDKRGKIRKFYKESDIMTPYEKLKYLPNFEQYLRDGITAEDLSVKESMLSDNDAAAQMNNAVKELFEFLTNERAN